MQLDLISIFPEYFDVLKLSLIGKANDAKIIQIAVHDLRKWTHDRHHTTDDTPYGGGAGMVMKPEPWGEALDELSQPDGSPITLIVPSPAGLKFDQGIAEELAKKPRLVFACGRYEGIDQRVLDYARTKFEVRELSIGDYVLNGGEVASLAIIEAVVRLIPKVIGNPESLKEESYSMNQKGLLEYPNYTKPPLWRGFKVPEVLLSGDHGKIAQWRNMQAKEITKQRRPDLFRNE